jgi:hypothetical protein
MDFIPRNMQKKSARGEQIYFIRSNFSACLKSPGSGASKSIGSWCAGEALIF